MSDQAKINRPSPTLAERLLRLVKGEASVDEAAEGVLEHLDRTERRIATTRLEVKRGIRPREGRFRL